ncbi:hypothetical protein BH11CYA1_BH11CYA1_18130 [soil metagenome]
MNTFDGQPNFICFDAATIFIMFAPMFLAFSIMLLAFKKRFFALRPANLSINAASGEPLAAATADGRIRFAAKRLDLYLYGLIIANILAAIFLSNVTYVVLPGEPFGSFLSRYLIPMITAVFASIACVVPFFALAQAIRAKTGEFIPDISPGSPTRIVYSSLIFVFLALWTIPFCQAFWVPFGAGPGYLHLLKDLSRVCVALSTIPLSAIGVIIAFASTSRYGSVFDCAFANHRIHQQSLSRESLAALSEERLHQIINDALLTQNVEAGEIASLHLLERAEASTASASYL